MLLSACVLHDVLLQLKVLDFYDALITTIYNNSQHVLKQDQTMSQFVGNMVRILSNRFVYIMLV